MAQRPTYTGWRESTIVSVGLLRPGRQCCHSEASAFRQPSATCSTSLPSQHLRPPCLLNRRPIVWNSLRDFIRDPTIGAECFRRLLKNVFVRWILVHSARQRFLTITALINPLTYLLTYLTLGLPSFFCDIGYQGVGGYHPPLNFVIILFNKNW